MAQKYIVGDIVMYDNKIMIVKEPRDGSHFDLSCYKKGLVYCLVDVDEIKPVELTPEILEKNEWKKSKINDWEYFYYKDEVFITYIPNNNKFCFCDFDYGYGLRIEIPYIHSLQHLLFGLGLDSNMIV